MRQPRPWTPLTRGFGFPRISFDVLPSTMEVAFQLAMRGAVNGTTVVTRRQTSGRGRQGRTWASSPGDSLTFSILFRSGHDHSSLGLLSPMCALALIRTLEQLGVGDIAFKWPNDVQVGGRKVCGILLQSRPLPGEDAFAVVAGIGLNLRRFPDLPDFATALSDHLLEAPTATQVLDVLSEHLGRLYEGFVEGEFADLIESLADRLAFRDEFVSIRDGERELIGVVGGLDAAGRLLLRGEGGAVTSIVSGELTRGPRPVG